MEAIKKNKTLTAIHNALKDSKLNDEEILVLRNMLRARYPSNHIESANDTETLENITLMLNMSKDFDNDSARKLEAILEKNYPKASKPKEELPEDIALKMIVEIGRLRAGQIQTIDTLVSLHKDYEAVKEGQSASR